VQTFDYARTAAADRVTAARKLLAEEGFTPEKPLTFELRYNSGEVHNKVAVAVASMWKEALGVDVKLAAVEFRSLMADVERRDIDVYRLSWVGDYNDAYNFLQYLKSDFGINLPHYSSEAYDALLREAGQQTDATLRRELLQKAESLMLADHPVIPLYFYVNKHLVKPELLGWYDNVMNVVYSQDLRLATQS
jgi:oligopeptide transport system substrate-binding protein